MANAVIPVALADQLLLVVALSMLLTPALFILYEKVIAPRFDAPEVGEEEDDMAQGTVIIAGHGRFGGIVNRLLRYNGIEPVVVDFSSAQLEVLRTFDLRVYYGDATRPDLLHAAGIERASVLVVAIDGKEQITELVRYVRQTYPDVHIVARAVDRPHVYALYAAGCRDIIRETFDSSLRAGRSTLEALGMHPYEAERKARRFRQFDNRHIARLAEVFDPELPLHKNTEYVARTKEITAEDAEIMKGEGNAFSNRPERGWSPPSLEDVEAVTNKKS